jgi:hypothetical protein
MIDDAPTERAEQKGAKPGGVAGSDGSPEGVEAATPPKARTLLISALFLFACIAGAAGMSLLSLFRP